MSYLDFFAAITSSLAWPAAALASIVVLRRAIVGFMARATKVAGYGVAVEAAPISEQIEDVARREVTVAAIPGTASPDQLDKAAAAKKEETRLLNFATIVSTWTLVELSLRQAVEKMGLVKDGRPIFPSEHAKQLAVFNLLSIEDVESLKSMQRRRSELVHSSEAQWTVTPEETKAFTTKASEIVKKLEFVLQAKYVAKDMWL